MNHTSIKYLNHLLGDIDIYLLDQVLKGRFRPHFKILDAGCDEGRNLIYFVHNDCQVYGIDRDTDAIKMLKQYAKSINNTYPIERFVTGKIEDTHYRKHEFDAIISSAVLHFAENKDHFLELLREMLRILKPGGFFLHEWLLILE